MIQFQSDSRTCHSVTKLCLTLWSPWYSEILCPSLSPGVCSNSCLLSWWCYQTICPLSHPLLLLLSIFPIFRVCFQWMGSLHGGQIPFQILFLYRLLQNSEYRSLFYTVSSCCLSGVVCYSQSPNLFLPSPLRFPFGSLKSSNFRGYIFYWFLGERRLLQELLVLV